MNIGKPKLDLISDIQTMIHQDKCFAYFNRGYTNSIGAERTSGLKEVVIPENIQNVYKFTLKKQ